MNFKSFIESGKKGRIKNSPVVNEYGLAAENDSGNIIFSVEGKPDYKLGVLHILSEDWELERTPRVFYLGKLGIQSHDRTVTVLRAMEGEKPNLRTADGEEWIKCVEVLEQ